MDFLVVLTGLIAFASGVLSGVAGGGGGFIMVPYWLLIGMTPAQAAANGGFMAIGMGASTLGAFRKTSHFPKDKKLIWVLSIITFVAAVIGAFLLPTIDAEPFKVVVAVITLLSLPLLFINPKRIERRRYKVIGVVLYALIALIGSIIFSSTFGILMMINFSLFFGMSVLQSTALRRYTSLIQAIVLFVLLAVQGSFVLGHAVAGLIGAVAGGYIGTKYIIKKGENFAKYALVVGGVLSAVALLLI